MRNLVFISLMICLFVSCKSPNDKNEPPHSQNTEHLQADYAIVIHGGAGTILKKNMTPELEKAYSDALNSALDIGEGILKNGGSSEEAVIATIEVMEQSPLFNAGIGAVFTNKGKNELDASIMRGKDQMAGAVGGVSHIKSPIKAARQVMNNSSHVLLVGQGAETFAKDQGLDMVDSTYFFTQRRYDALQRILKEEKEKKKQTSELSENKHGTVGCVALDRDGNIVAGTSTGGMTNKRWNRIGDSPIIGAGTYANNATCGISCTGWGEYFIRYSVAYDVSARMEYLGEDIQTAADAVVNKKLKQKGGTGGLVGLDRYGNIAMPFNTEGMYRGYRKPGESVVEFYKN